MQNISSYAADLDREQNMHDNPWLLFLHDLRMTGVKPPKGTSFMSWASKLYAVRKGITEEGPAFDIQTVTCRPVNCSQDESENDSLYSATMELGYYDPADFSEATVAVDFADPLSILLAKEEGLEVADPTQSDVVEAVVVVKTKFVGCDVCQPKERDEAFPPANFSRPQYPSKARSWDEVMVTVKVSKLDTMWRTFLALARHDEYKARQTRRQGFERRNEINRALERADVALNRAPETWYKLPAHYRQS